MSRPGHDAYDENGDVQIKMTAGCSVPCTPPVTVWLFSGFYRRKKPRTSMMVPVIEASSTCGVRGLIAAPARFPPSLNFIPSRNFKRSL